MQTFVLMFIPVSLVLCCILLAVAFGGICIEIWRAFQPRIIEPLDGGMAAAMRAKDPELYAGLCHKPIHEAWRVWKQAHPEDFPLGSHSPISSASIVRASRGHNG